MSTPSSYIPRLHPALPEDNCIFLITSQGCDRWRDICKDIKGRFAAAGCKVRSVEYPCKQDSGRDPSETFKAFCASAEEAEKALAIAERIRSRTFCEALPYANYQPNVGAMALPRVLRPDTLESLPLSEFPPLGDIWKCLREWGPIYDLHFEADEQIDTIWMEDGPEVAVYTWCIWVKFYYEKDARNFDKMVSRIWEPVSGLEFTAEPLIRCPTPTGPNMLGSETFSIRLEVGPDDTIYDWGEGRDVKGSEILGIGSSSDATAGRTSGPERNGTSDAPTAEAPIKLTPRPSLLERLLVMVG